MTMMAYKGSEASVEYGENAEIFHGEVISLRDVIASPLTTCAESATPTGKTSRRHANELKLFHSPA